MHGEARVKSCVNGDVYDQGCSYKTVSSPGPCMLDWKFVERDE